jgi:hypothetical protein
MDELIADVKKKFVNSTDSLSITAKNCREDAKRTKRTNDSLVNAIPVAYFYD